MSVYRRWVKRLRPLVRKEAVEGELDEEIAFHLDMEMEKYRKAGLDEAECRRRAVVAFGGVEGHREAVRDSRWISSLETIVVDVRVALRQFRRAPLARTAMLLILSMGIAVNTALYAGVQSALTLPAPGVPRDASLVRIRGAQDVAVLGRSDRPLSYSEVLEYAGREEVFRDVAAWTSSSVVLDLGRERQKPISARANYVSGNYFSLLGVSHAAGAGLPATRLEEPSRDLVAVISHDLWTSRFGGSAAAVGSSLRINGIPVQISGVAPPGFHGVNNHPGGPSLWLPLAAQATLDTRRGSALEEPDSSHLQAFGRLVPGVDREAAEAAVGLIASRLPDQTFFDHPMVPLVEVVPLTGGNSLPSAEKNVATVAALFSALTLLILLITCTNVSGLLVGAALARRREIAMRLSLGASRVRIVSQLLVESMMLSLGAGLAGMLMVWGALRLFGRYVPGLRMELDWRVAAFTFGFALLTGVIFGLSPALHASRAGIGEVLKDAAAAVSGSRSRLQRGLVVAQIAVTQPLLVGLGATLLVIGTELRQRPSRDVFEQVVSMGFDTSAGNLSFDARRTEIAALVDRFEGLPGVLGAVPSYGGSFLYTVTVPAEERVAGIEYRPSYTIESPIISPGYFELLDVPIVRGRLFTDEDLEAETTPIMVGADLASELWGDSEPIGRHLAEGDVDEPGFTVIGVVDDRFIGTRKMGEPVVYSLPRGTPSGVLIRTQGAAEAMIPFLRSVASADAPDLVISEVTTVAAEEARTRAAIMRLTGAATAGGLLALLLAAVGLYALISLAVGQRRREIGIRTAVGAQPGQVVGMFFRGGLKLSLIGLALGLPMSLLALRLFSTRLEIPKTSTPILSAMIAVGVIAVAALASWLPARQAVGVDAARALRID